jgi:hypothetical protein
MVTACHVGSPRLGGQVVSCRCPQPFVLPGVFMSWYWRYMASSLRGLRVMGWWCSACQVRGPQAAVLAVGRHVADSIAASVDGPRQSLIAYLVMYCRAATFPRFSRCDERPDAGRMVRRNYPAVGQDLAHVVEHDHAVA